MIKKEYGEEEREQDICLSGYLHNFEVGQGSMLIKEFFNEKGR